MKYTWHLWTPENHPIIFKSDEDFKVGMTIMGLVALSNPDVVILSFELMSNHIHATLIGEEDDVKIFFQLLRDSLGKALGGSVNLTGFNCSLRRLESELEVRNSITYGNRNGFLVNPDTTPFTYRWGANRYFFNPEAKKRYKTEAKEYTVREKRQIAHSRFAEHVNGLKKLDDYACPLSFCAVDMAERFYRSASNYFYEISRNIESHKQFSNLLGESIFYTDDEIYFIATSLAREKYGQTNLRQLPNDSKVEMAKALHYDYNSTKKQIGRLLSLDYSVLNALFPDPN
ncbi:MAG: hypothetical protein J6Z44_06170 [Bacteroidales bacterium]|nr:hypothetical protein [Bacteroidales bacterium]